MPYTQDNSPTTPTSEQDPSTTDFPVPKKGHVVALGVTLAVVAVLVAVAITYFVVRMRRMKAEQEAEESREEKQTHLPVRKSTVLDARHPASRITPFGTNKPGSKMRIARRREDGAWDFEDPEAPFTPNGVNDPAPSPLSPSPSMRSTTNGKAAEALAERDRRRDTSSSGVSAVEPPPPAYNPSEGHSTDNGYISRKD